MIIYLVLVLHFSGHTDPWGVFSTIDNAMQGQEDCAALNEPSWDDFVHGSFGNLMQRDRCVIWEWQLDGARAGHSPMPTLPRPLVPSEGVPSLD